MSYLKNAQFRKFCFKLGNFGNIPMRMCSVEVMHNFKGLHAREIPLEFIYKLLWSDCYPYLYLATLFIVTVFGFLFVCFFFLLVFYVFCLFVWTKLIIKCILNTQFLKGIVFNCTWHDYSVNIQVSCLIIYNSDLLYKSIYKIYNMTNLKYYIHDLINSKSKEKAVRNAENKMCLQRCLNVKKVVKAFDVENKLCL